MPSEEDHETDCSYLIPSTSDTVYHKSPQIVQCCDSINKLAIGYTLIPSDLNMAHIAVVHIKGLRHM